jgi:excisionase family DNA binding protein
MQPEVFNLKEAARFVRVSERTLREKARSRQVPCQRVGREWRFLRQALEDWLAGVTPAPDDGTGVVCDPSQLGLPGLAEAAPQDSFGDTAFTRNREEPLHRWVPWIAGFSASFVAEILERELGRVGKLALLDPFAGVGTTLVEGLKRHCEVFGFEINPYAALVCRVKAQAPRLDPRRVRRLAEDLAQGLGRAQESDAPKSAPPPGFQTRDPFFSPRVESQVLRLKDLVREHEEGPWRDLLEVAFGSILVGVSNYSYEPSLGRRVAAGKRPVLDADLGAAMRAKLLAIAEDIEWLRVRNGAPGAPQARIFNESYLEAAPARLPAGSIDVLITSPPYLNNYHYVRNTRPQMFWLDLVTRPSDLRRLETESFGKFWQTVRGDAPVRLAFEDPELEERLERLRGLNAERGAYGGPGWANYAATYFNDCARFCEVTAQVMKPGGLVVVVIGNNILQGVEFPTDRLLARIAERAGFEVANLHLVRKKRTGSSIVNSSVRVGAAKVKTELYETAVELRLKRPGA